MAPTAEQMRAYMASSIPPPPRDPATGLIDFNAFNGARGAFEAFPTDIRGHLYTASLETDKTTTHHWFEDSPLPYDDTYDDHCWFRRLPNLAHGSQTIWNEMRNLIEDRGIHEVSMEIFGDMVITMHNELDPALLWRVNALTMNAKIVPCTDAEASARPSPPLVRSMADQRNKWDDRSMPGHDSAGGPTQQQRREWQQAYSESIPSAVAQIVEIIKVFSGSNIPGTVDILIHAPAGEEMDDQRASDFTQEVLDVMAQEGISVNGLTIST
jgi:hypothetical protein